MTDLLELVIVIDVQNDFLNMMNDEFKKSLVKLCQYCKLLKKKVLFIKSHYGLDDVGGKVENNVLDRLNGTHHGKPLCIKDSFGAEFIDDIKPFINSENAEILIKNFYSGFNQTNLDEYLKKHNIKKLVFCGLTINTCVKATVNDAIKMGYLSTIIEDCVIGKNDKMTAKGLDDINSLGLVHITTLSKYSKDFDVFCEGDTFIVNDIFPQNVCNEHTVFQDLIRECNWKSMEIQGGIISREVDVMYYPTFENLVPVYRNPSDKYIEPHPSSPTITKMFEWLNENIDLNGFTNETEKIKFNHLFLKYYKSCADGIGKHSDKTLDLKHNSFIANLSLGSTRKFTLTSKIDSNHVINISLKSNSILFIGMETNKKWLHEVKPDKRPKHLKTLDEISFDTQRMSLTFRTASTFYNVKTKTLHGQGAPKIILNLDEPEKLEIEKNRLIKAFSMENKLADFDWIEYYSTGFNVMSCKN